MFSKFFPISYLMKCEGVKRKPNILSFDYTWDTWSYTILSSTQRCLIGRYHLHHLQLLNLTIGKEKHESDLVFTICQETNPQPVHQSVQIFSLDTGTLLIISVFHMFVGQPHKNIPRHPKVWPQRDSVIVGYQNVINRPKDNVIW